MANYLISLAITTTFFAAALAYIVWRAKRESEAVMRASIGRIEAAGAAARAALPVLVPPPPPDLTAVDADEDEVDDDDEEVEDETDPAPVAPPVPAAGG